MNWWDFAWLGIFAAFLTFEFAAIRNTEPEDTLSERTRFWWRLKTTPGRVTFAVAWVAFSAWLLWHMLFQ